MTLAVLEPATEAVLAEIPRAGAEEADAAVARAKAAYPAWRAVAPADRARLLHRLADALAAEHEELAVLEARNAGKPIGDARGEIGMVVDTFRFYAGRGRAHARRHDPGRRRRGDDVPRAARRRRADHAVELPAHDRLVEARAVPRRRQHGRAQAGRADAADARSSSSGSRSTAGLPEGVVNVVAGPGSTVRRAARRASRRRQGRVHRLDRGRPADRRGRGARRSSASRSSWAASRRTSCSPTPTCRRRRRPRRGRCSATPARTAARARGSSSSSRCWTSSWPR